MTYMSNDVSALCYSVWPLAIGACLSEAGRSADSVCEQATWISLAEMGFAASTVFSFTETCGRLFVSVPASMVYGVSACPGQREVATQSADFLNKQCLEGVKCLYLNVRYPNTKRLSTK